MENNVVMGTDFANPFDNWVKDKLVEHYPGLEQYAHLIPQAIDLRGRDESAVDWNEKNINRYIFGTSKHIAIHHHLTDLIGDTDEEIQSKYEDFIKQEDEIFDWNQKILIESRVKEILIDDKVRGEESDYRKITRTLNKEFPLRHVDMKKVPGYKDYRLPENKLELAIRNYMCRTFAGDLDHWHSGYVAADWLGLNDQQKAWYAMYFGFSYRTQWASMAIQVFKDGDVDPDLVDWWTGWSPDEEGVLQHNGIDNYSIIPVGKDCRYNKNNWHICYRGLVDYAEGDLYGKLYEAAHSSDDPNENFKNLEWEIRQLPRFGRMTTFLAMQLLYQFFDWPISGHEMMLGDSNTWSSRIGLYWIINDKIEPEQDIIDRGTPSPTAEELVYLNQKTQELLDQMTEQMPIVADVFNLESEECETYDKYALKQRETNFWSSTELNDLTGYVIQDWADYNKWLESEDVDIPQVFRDRKVDLKPLVLGQFTKRPEGIGGIWPDTRWYLTLKHLGIPTQFHYTFEDQANLFDHLDIGAFDGIKCDYIQKCWDEWFTPDEQKAYMKKYDPRFYLKWKKNIDTESKYYKALTQDNKDFISKLDEYEAAGKLYFNRV